jgi:hypothetical protein
MLTQKTKDDWQKAFEKQMDIAEKPNIAKVKRYYKREYNKGIQSFLSLNATNYENTFLTADFIKLYAEIYKSVGLRFAKWYARNFDKYIKKGINPRQFESIWEQQFLFLGQAIAARRVTLVSGTAKKTLRNIFRSLLSDQEFMQLGEQQQARVLRRKFNRYSQTQAERLVRTESTLIANYATMQSALSIFPGAQMKKEWIASFDDRTRDAHAQADGQIVNYDDTFIVGVDFMKYPGDPAASAENIINCRCSVAPFPDDFAESITDIDNIGFGLSRQTTF